MFEEGGCHMPRPFTASLCALVKVSSVAQVAFLTEQGGCAVNAVIL